MHVVFVPVRQGVEHPHKALAAVGMDAGRIGEEPFAFLICVPPHNRDDGPQRAGLLDGHNIGSSHRWS